MRWFAMIKPLLSKPGNKMPRAPVWVRSSVPCSHLIRHRCYFIFIFLALHVGYDLLCRHSPRIVGSELESELSPQVCPPLSTRSTCKNAIWMHRSAQNRQCWLCKSSCLVYTTSQDYAKSLNGSTDMRVLIISCIWLLYFTYFSINMQALWLCCIPELCMGYLWTYGHTSFNYSILLFVCQARVLFNGDPIQVQGLSHAVGPIGAYQSGNSAALTIG